MVAWQSVYWDDILRLAQDAYLKAAYQSADLNARAVRTLLLHALGDAAGYRYEVVRPFCQVIARAKVDHLLEPGDQHVGDVPPADQRLVAGVALVDLAVPRGVRALRRVAAAAVVASLRK